MNVSKYTFPSQNKPETKLQRSCETICNDLILRIVKKFLDTNKRQDESTNPPQENTKNKLGRKAIHSEEQHPTVLCLLDYSLGNMIIHYSKTRVLHPRQGLEDLFEVIMEENLLGDTTKLIYLLIGWADISLNPGVVARNVETLLENVAKLQPRIMTVIGAIVINPLDPMSVRADFKRLI